MLVVPILDVFFIFDMYTQELVIVQEGWAVWICSGMQTYLIIFNYDLVFGTFNSYFGIEFSPIVEFIVRANFIVGIVFVITLVTFSILMRKEFKLSFNSIIEKFNDF